MSTKLKQAVVEACGRNYGAAVTPAPFNVQQRLYAQMMRKLAKVDPEDRDAYQDAGRVWWQNKGMKGPGVDW